MAPEVQSLQNPRDYCVVETKKEFSRKEEMVTRVNAAKKSSKERPEKYELYFEPPSASNYREEWKQEWVRMRRSTKKGASGNQMQ